MILFCKEIIKAAANSVGIESIIDATKDNITLPKPRLDVQFFTEVYKKTGKRLSIEKGKADIKTTLTIYKAILPIACTLHAVDYTQLETLSNSFIKALPRKFEDDSNNIVKLWVTSSNWQLSGGKQIGDTKIEIISKNSRLIKLDFTYHVTEEFTANYLTQFKTNIHMGVNDEQKR